MNLLETLKHDADGLAILKEWLGDGGEPVAPIHAELRAAICSVCPENRGGNWWDKFKNQIARTIRKHLEFKHRVGLSVSTEANLHMCRACGCALPLKVWVPVKHLKTHVSEKTISKMPSFCWIKKELT